VAVTKDQLVVEVKVNNDGFDQKFQKSVASLSSFSDSADASTKKVQQFEAILSDVRETVDSVTIGKMTNEFARLIGINESLVKSLTESQQSLLKTSQSFDSSSQTSKNLSSDLKFIAGVAKDAAISMSGLSAPLAAIEASGIDKSLNSVAQNSEKLSEVTGYSDMSVTVKDLSTSLDTAAQSSDALNKQFMAQGEVASSLATSLSTLFVSVQSFITLTNGLLQIFESLTNAETLAKLSHLADQLGMVADIKGFDKTADAVRAIGDALSYAATKSIEFQERFKQNVERINFLIEAQDRATSMAATSAEVLGAAFLGIGINKVGQNFETYRKNVSPIITMMTDLTGSTSRFGKAFSSLSSPMLKVVEVLFMLSPALATFSDKLLDSENSLLKILGAVSLVAAILGGTLGYAISFVLGKISDLTTALGISMLASLTEAEHKFEKLQEVMSQFRYTLEGLSRELGVNVVGSFKKWHGVLDLLRRTTTFATVDISKAVKLLVSEGARFGLSQAQITNEIVRVADVAAAYGENIVDVAQKFNAAMAGNAQSLQNMGFAVGQNNLVHSQLYQSLGKTTDALTEQELAAIKMDLILRETSSTIGAAANQAKTLAGSSQILLKSQDDIAAAMGSTNTIIIQLNAAYAHLIRSIAYFGEPLFEVIGSLKQYIGITLVVVGTLFKHMIAITTLAKAYEVLNTSTSASGMVTKHLSTAFAFLGSHLGFTAVSVTNLATVLQNLSKLTMALAIKSMTALVSMARTVAIGFIGASRAVLMFTASLLTNPVFIKAAVIAVGIAAIVKAVYDLSQELYFVKKALDDTFGSFGSTLGKVGSDTENVFVSVINSVTKVINSSFKFIANLIKLSLAGLTTIILLVKKAMLFKNEMDIKSKWSIGDKEVKALKDIKAQQEGINDALGDTIYAIEQTTEELGSVIVPQALAAKGFDNMSAKAKQENDNLERFVRNQMRGFDLNIERAIALGDEFDQLNAKIRQADQEIKKAYASNKDFDEKAKSIAEAKINLLKQEIELEKKRNEISKSVDQQRKGLQLEQLKRSGQNYKAINLEFTERMDNLLEEEKGLKKINQLRLEDQIIINATVKALKAAKASAVEDEKIKNLEKIRDIQEKITEIQKDNLASSRNEIDAINQRVLDRNKEIEAAQRALRTNADIREEATALWEIAKRTNEENGKAAIERKRLEYLKATVLETNTMQNSLSELYFLGLDSIKAQNKESIIAIENKRVEAQFQGMLTEQVKAQLDVQERIAGEIYGKQISNIKRSHMLFGDFFQDFKEYFSMMSDLTGMSLSKVFDGLEGILKNAISLAGKFREKVTGKVTESSPNFVGPPKEDKPSVVSEMMGKASKMATDAIASVSSSVTDLIPPEVGNIASDVGSAVGEMGNIYMMIAKAIMDMPKIILGVLDGVSNALQALMDFPRALINALGRLDRIIAKAIDFLPGAIQGLAAALPSILKKIAAKLPDLIIAVADALPELAEALAEVLPDLVGKLVSRIPDLVSSLTKSLGFAIWRMIVGLFRGIGDVWKGWKSPELKIGIDKNYFSKTLASLTQDTNKIFTVNALANAYKGAESMVNEINDVAGRIGKNIWGYFVRAMKDGWKWLMEAGGKIWSGLKTAAEVIGDWGTKIWNALADGASVIGDWGTKIWNGLTGAIGDIATTLGGWGTAIWDGLTGAIGQIGDTLGAWGKAIWDGFLATIGTSFEGFGGSISTGFSNALPAIGKAIDGLFTGLGKVFQTLFKLDFTGIKTAITDAFTSGGELMKGAFRAVFNPMIDVINGIIDALNGIKIPAITYGGSILGRDFGGTLIGETDLIPGEISKIARLASGGPVNGPGGVDMVPAMLTAGEFVINRQAASAIGLPTLNALNQGKGVDKPVIQNISLNLSIESKDRIDENFVRQRIMPALREELKRGSLDGRAVVYAGGVRK